MQVLAFEAEPAGVNDGHFQSMGFLGVLVHVEQRGFDALPRKRFLKDCFGASVFEVLEERRRHICHNMQLSATSLVGWRPLLFG